MNSNDENIDRLFKDKLNNHEVVPPDSVWDGIISEMDSGKRRRRAFFILGISSAASLLFAFIGGWYFANNDKGVVNYTSEAGVDRKTVIINENESYKANEAESSAGYLTVEKRIDKTNNTITRSSVKEKAYNEDKNGIISSDNVSEEANFIYKLLIPRKEKLKSDKKEDYTLLAMNTDDLSEEDKSIIEMNLRNIKEKSYTKKKGEWAIGVQASPAYRFDGKENSFNDYYEEDQASYNYSMNYVTNVTGGVVVAYSIDKKLTVQSGVNYGEISQVAHDVNVSYTGQNWLNDRLGVMADEKYLGGNKAGEVDNEVELNTLIGVANVSMQEGTQIKTTGESNTLSPEVIRPYELNQDAGYVEVPLIIKYMIIDKKFGVHVLGGINTNFLVINDVKISNNNEVVANGEIEGLNPLTFSSSLGLGFNYSFTRNLKFSLEPTIKMQLNSLSSVSEINSRPYMFGVFTGLSYNF